MKSLTKSIFTHIGLFIGLIGILWSLLAISSMIPNESLKDNYMKSAIHYGNKEAFEFTDDSWNSIRDNYADVILMNISWQMGEGDSAFLDVIDTDYYDGDGAGENAGFYYAVSEGRLPNKDYTRYWHRICD